MSFPGLALPASLYVTDVLSSEDSLLPVAFHFLFYLWP